MPRFGIVPAGIAKPDNQIEVSGQIRKPKLQIRSKSEYPNSRRLRAEGLFEFRVSSLLRISSFGFLAGFVHFFFSEVFFSDGLAVAATALSGALSPPFSAPFAGAFSAPFAAP